MDKQIKTEIILAALAAILAAIATVGIHTLIENLAAVGISVRIGF